MFGTQGKFANKLQPNPHKNISFPYLKLHGSLNWSNKKKNELDLIHPENILQASHSPLILPPVFNKMTNPKIDTVWDKAINVLSNTKNIIFFGYSLPLTDVYMSYFIKSVVGANPNLNKVIVLDPVMNEKGPSKDSMEKRYRDCFSIQFRDRVEFNPDASEMAGTFLHLNRILSQRPKDILFKS